MRAGNTTQLILTTDWSPASSNGGGMTVSRRSRLEDQIQSLRNEEPSAVGEATAALMDPALICCRAMCS